LMRVLIRATSSTHSCRSACSISITSPYDQ
jgi:hypothetical protein